MAGIATGSTAHRSPVPASTPHAPHTTHPKQAAPADVPLVRPATQRTAASPQGPGVFRLGYGHVEHTAVSPQVPSSTRTRHNHGAVSMGGYLACVYSTRSAGRCFGVSLEVGAGTLTLAASMTPPQARSFARALVAAADAVARVELQAQQPGGAA